MRAREYAALLGFAVTPAGDFDICLMGGKEPEPGPQ
jgi:hypothetical protein